VNDTELRREICKILQAPAYPTAPQCPYCDFTIAFGRKMGLAQHVITTHPQEVRNHDRVQKIIDLIHKEKDTK
jgi:hypothetical protein